MKFKNSIWKRIIKADPFIHAWFLVPSLAVYFIISLKGYQDIPDYPKLIQIWMKIWLYDIIYVVAYWIIWRMIIWQWILKKH
jgi:hypothetical protein